MKIIKIEWRNIFSYGNKIETLDFGNTGKLWQLSGRSGAGKSSLLAIPKLMLYGKAEGGDGKPFKLSAIANRINKNGWIRGTVVNGRDTYVIERTFSPQSLVVYKNGENLDKAGLRDMQGIIDAEILDHLPYHIFSNVMALSLNNFKSFISMSPNDKRQIIDKIFSLEILNKVYELIKKDMKDLGNIINTSNAQIYNLEQTIKTSNNELLNLQSKNKTSNKDVLDELKRKIEKTNELYNQYADVYKTYYDKLVEFNNYINSINSNIQQHNNELLHIQQKINLFNEDKCPTCGSSLSGVEFDDIRTQLKNTYDNEICVINDLKEKLELANKSKNDISCFLYTLQQNLSKIQAKQNEFAVESKSILSASNKSEEYKSIQNIISETEKTKKSIEQSVSEANSRMNMLNIMETMYSADGIKKNMMENYIPTLNEEIKHTLISLSFPYTLEFDNSFNPHLECLGEQIEVQSLSAGEHKKVDLAVLCAILRMLKRKYPQVNLVCLDETLSSLDYESSTDIITYLQEIANTMALNIFIVSHTQLDENLFDVRIHIDKNSGFSDLTYI